MNTNKPKKGDIVVKAPTASGLLPKSILRKVETACKIKSQIDALNAELEPLKQEILEQLIAEEKTRVACSYGLVQAYKGKKIVTVSEWANLQLKAYRADLEKQNPEEFTEGTGKPYLTVSATEESVTQEHGG